MERHSDIAACVCKARYSTGSNGARQALSLPINHELLRIGDILHNVAEADTLLHDLRFLAFGAMCTPTIVMRRNLASISIRIPGGIGGNDVEVTKMDLSPHAWGSVKLAHFHDGQESSFTATLVPDGSRAPYKA